MFNRATAFFTATLLATAALAQGAILRPGDHISDKIATLDFGVICAQEIIAFQDAPGTVAGTTNVIDADPVFISRNPVVPAVLGVGFGVKAQTVSPLGIDGVTMTVTHPPMGAQGATEQTFGTTISGLDQSLTFYQFDVDYELLVGPWVMEAHYNGETLYRVAFDVVPPAAAPELTRVCGFEELLS